jgi:hypothetical protein
VIAPRLVVVAVVSVLVLCASAAAALWATSPKVTSRTPEVATRNPDANIVLQMQNVAGLDDSEVRATLDGKDVSDDVDVSGSRIVLDVPTLAEGKHEVTVSTERFGPLQRRIDERWSFSVDGTPPPVNFERGSLRSDVRNARFRLKTEPGATVTYTSGPHVTRDSADDNGNVSTLVRLKEGRQQVRIVAKDAVGNVTRRTRTIEVDSISPFLSLPAPRKLTTPELSVRVAASDANGVELKATVGGSSEDLQLRRSGRIGYTLSRAEKLPEGTHQIAVTATDGFGHTKTVRKSVLVDSTEQLGENAMQRGARGADVRQLHMQLAKLGFFKRKTEKKARQEWNQKRFGAATAAAVCGFQRDKGLEADCIAGEETLAVMTLRITIDRGTNKLTLYRLDKVVKVYGVATGAAEFPTPAGEFEIVDMQKNPTWTPPDSDWAKGEKPIPPGPNNPLGTRWMGLDVPAVGIHGTNNPASIGYSVSHGCIRMAIPDVEDLFERVEIGTPVTIV